VCYKSPLFKFFPLQNSALVVGSGLLFSTTFFSVCLLNKLLICVLIVPIALMHPLLFLLSTLLGLLSPNHPIEFLNLKDLFLSSQKAIESKFDAIYPPEIAQFYKTFLLGKSAERNLSFMFQSLGLSHLLAISGFHFQSILSTFDLILSRCFKGRTYLSILLLVAVGYILLVQLSPSVLRSFLSIFLTLLAPITKRFSDSKNIFFLSYFLVFLLMPEKFHQLGSVLSFLATFGILFYSRNINNFFEKNFLKTSLYFFPSFKNRIKKFFFDLLSLNLAVTFVTLPYILLQIKEFPPLALITNLFIPPLMLPTVFLCVVSLALPPFAPLCSWYTKKILLILELVPRPFTFNLTAPPNLEPWLETALILIIALPILRSCLKTADTV